VVLGADPAQVRVGLSHRGHRAGIDAIGLAPVAIPEQASPRGKRRRHVEHGLSGSDKLLGEEVTETVGSLHRLANRTSNLLAGRFE
jgi:hypothetical protein